MLDKDAALRIMNSMQDHVAEERRNVALYSGQEDHAPMLHAALIDLARMFHDAASLVLKDYIG